MDAIISDVHGNLAALEAVLNVIRQWRVSRVFCLGNVVGYGPDSVDCVSADWDITIAGDWDRAMLDHAPGEWPATLNRHLAFLRDQIGAAADASALRERLGSYRPSFEEADGLYVHGTPGNPRGWIFPEDIYCPERFGQIADEFDGPALFCGHTHIPGVFRLAEGACWEFHAPRPGDSYRLTDATKTIVTVGSVGQPRDGDPRAAFVIRDGDRIQFVRVPYDVRRTVRRIRSLPAIDPIHADRLLEGR